MGDESPGNVLSAKLGPGPGGKFLQWCSTRTSRGGSRRSLGSGTGLVGAAVVDDDELPVVSPRGCR